MRRHTRQDGRDSQRGAKGADSQQPSLLHSRDEKPQLLIRGLAAIAEKFRRRGHVFDALLLCWLLEIKSGPDGRCVVKQEVLNSQLRWGENQRKIKEVRDALALAGWVEVIRRCPTCDGESYLGIRLNWPTIAMAAARGDADHHLVTAVTIWWEQSPFGDGHHHAPYKEYENCESENLNFSHTHNSPARAESHTGPGDWWLPTELRGQTQDKADARRLLRDPRFVRAAWEDARSRLPDLRPRDFRGFAIAAHYAARPEGGVSHAGRLFVHLVQRRAWRLPPKDTAGNRVEGHIPNKAEDDARPLLVALGLEAPIRESPAEEELNVARFVADQARLVAERFAVG